MSNTGADNTKAEFALMQEPDRSGRMAMEHHRSKACPVNSFAGTGSMAAIPLSAIGCVMVACKAAGKDSSSSQKEQSEMQAVEAPVFGSGSTGIGRPQVPEQGGAHHSRAGAAWAEDRAQKLRETQGRCKREMVTRMIRRVSLRSATAPARGA